MNIESLKAKFKENALSRTEGQYITFHPEALFQMNGYIDRLVVEKKYSDDRLTEDDLEIADSVLGLFDPDNISGEVIDGVIQPTTKPLYENALASVTKMAMIFELGHILAMKIVAEEVAKQGGFYR